MDIRELKIEGAWEIVPRVHGDDRGAFAETYRFDRLSEATGHRFDLAQANTSVSRRGVVRGIHFADVPPSQAKYVTCSSGVILDFVIDIRIGSPTFGKWDAVRIDSVSRNAAYLSEGLGHAFVALTEDAVVTYLVSSVFNAEREHGINPLDADVALRFPEEAGELLLSTKDTDAPSLLEAEASGLLPRYDDVLAFRESLRNG